MQIVLNGSAIFDIPSFYAEINRVMMADEDWKIGESLDALDDLLYGGYGAIGKSETVELVWENAEQSRKALGFETTKAYYEQKLAPGSRFNKVLFQQKLSDLEAGKGSTYFDIVLEIIANHPNILLTTVPPTIS